MAKRDRCPLLFIAAAAAIVYALTGFQPGFPVSLAQAEEKLPSAAVSAVPEKQAAPAAAQDAEASKTEDAASVAAAAETKPAGSSAAEVRQETKSAAEEKPEVRQETKQETAPLPPVPTVTPAGYVRTQQKDPVTPSVRTPDWRSYCRFDAPVDAYYFSDALFIGDSRTVGLSEYCPDLDAQATFYSKVSLTVKAALDKSFVKTEDGRKSVDELLTGERQYKKIYVMLGINEIGGGTAESFREDYRVMLERIREKQPGALIFIQSIMHVTAKKGSGERNINNAKINERNAAIAELADPDQGIYYLDINEAVDDENGDLNAALSFDGVHLKAASYSLWYDYLRTHVYVSRSDGDDDA